MFRSLTLFILVLVFASLTLGARRASAADYYVSTGGSDSNSGSSSSPWKTIQHANSIVKAGDTVHVAAGTYYITSTINTSTSGSSGYPITYVSDSRWAAKIISNATLDACWEINGNYVTVKGFDVTESSSGSCRLGIESYASHTLITNNRVHDLQKAPAIATCDGGPGATGIGTYNTTGYNDIIGNVVGRIGNWTVHNCVYIQGIYSASPYTRVMNNIVYEAMSFGVNLGAYSSNNVVANNTIVASGYAGVWVDSASTSAYIVNNIAFNTNVEGIKFNWAPCSASIYNNLVYGSSQPYDSNSCSPTSANLTTAPVFVNYSADGTGDYHLASNSPGIDKGTGTKAPTTDFDNFARPYGAGFDIGAYEYHGSATPAPSPTPSASPTPVPTTSSTGIYVTLTPSSLTFGNQTVGTTSAVQYVTLKNTGTSTMTFSSDSISGDFAFAGLGTCGSTLAAGATCTYSVKFTPTATGTRTGTLTIYDNASNGPQKIPLSGTGVTSTTSAPAVTISPSSLTFGPQAVGDTSSVQYATITNTGTVTLTFKSDSISGDFAFAGLGSCGSTLAVGASCTYSVKFQPTMAGTRTGTVTIYTNAINSPHYISLSGTGY